MPQDQESTARNTQILKSSLPQRKAHKIDSVVDFGGWQWAPVNGQIVLKQQGP